MSEDDTLTIETEEVKQVDPGQEEEPISTSEENAPEESAPEENAPVESAPADKDGEIWQKISELQKKVASLERKVKQSSSKKPSEAEAGDQVEEKELVPPPPGPVQALPKKKLLTRKPRPRRRVSGAVRPKKRKLSKAQRT
jgi:hypothetical protein